MRVGCSVCFGSGKIGDGGTWRVVHLDHAVVGWFVGTSQWMGRGMSNIYIRYGRGPEVVMVECIAVHGESLHAALCRGILVT